MMKVVENNIGNACEDKAARKTKQKNGTYRARCVVSLTSGTSQENQAIARKLEAWLWTSSDTHANKPPTWSARVRPHGSGFKSTVESRERTGYKEDRSTKKTKGHDVEKEDGKGNNAKNPIKRGKLSL